MLSKQHQAAQLDPKHRLDTTSVSSLSSNLIEQKGVLCNGGEGYLHKGEQCLQKHIVGSIYWIQWLVTPRVQLIQTLELLRHRVTGCVRQDA